MLKTDNKDGLHATKMSTHEFTHHIQGTLMTLGELRIRRKTAEVTKGPMSFGNFFRQATTIGGMKKPNIPKKGGAIEKIMEESSIDELNTSSFQLTTERDMKSLSEPNLVTDTELMPNEQSYKLRKISGLDCMVQAKIQRGRVIGTASLATES